MIEASDLSPSARIAVKALRTLRRQGCTYEYIGEQVGLTHNTIRNALNGTHLLTKGSIALIHDALNL